MLTIAIVEGENVGQRVSIVSTPFVIGREADCGLVLADPLVSRHHLRVDLAPDGGFSVRDLDSANGSYVGDERIKEAISLTAPARIRVGHTTLEVASTEPAAAAAHPLAVAPSPQVPPAAAPAVVAVPAPGVSAAAAAWVTPAAVASDATGGKPSAYSSVYRSAATRGGLAAVLVALACVARLASLVHTYQGFAIIDEAAGGGLSTGDANAYDSTTSMLAAIGVVALIAAAVAVLAWLSRSVDDVPSLGLGLPTVTPRAAIGWWFVPIANFWKPFQVAQDLRARVKPAGRDPTPWLLGAWWTLWIGGNLVAYVAYLVEGGATTLDTLRTSLEIQLLSSAGVIAAGVLLMFAIRQLQTWMDQRASATAG